MQMMYRIFLFAALFTCCFSIALPDVNQDDLADSEPEFGSDMVAGTGGGYSFFTKQHIESRPSARSQALLSDADLAAYNQGSAFNLDAFRTQSFPSNQDQSFTDAFNDQPFDSRSNFQERNFSPKLSSNTFGSNQRRQPSFPQNDFSQFQSSNLNGFGAQPSNFLSQNVFGNQQQDPSFIQSPQQIWNSQQNGGEFNPSSGGQGKQPVSSGFFMQNDRPSAMNTASQFPSQRRTFQSQPTSRQTDRFNGW